MGAFVSTPPPPSLPVAPERAPPKLIADETCSLTAISCLPLSPDLHRAIFLHLPRDELLFVIPRVCKSFRQMADERLWQMVCEGIFGERSVPLILMYGASELNAAHEEVLERRAVDDSIPWKALYVLLRRMAGKQLTVDCNTRDSFFHRAVNPPLSPSLSESEAMHILRDLYIVALTTHPHFRMAGPTPPLPECFSTHRSRKDLPHMTLHLSSGTWLEICFYNPPAEPSRDAANPPSDDSSADATNDDDGEAKPADDDAGDDATAADASSSSFHSSTAASSAVTSLLELPVKVEAPPTYPRLCVAYYRPSIDGEWSISFRSAAVTYYHPTLAVSLWKQGFGGPFSAASDSLLHTRCEWSWRSSPSYLHGDLTPLAPLHTLRALLVAEIDRAVDVAAHSALTTLFGKDCIDPRDPRKMREPILGKWLAKLLDGVKTQQDDIDFAKKRAPKPKRIRSSALPLIALTRCIRRLCRVLLESSLLQWVVLLREFSVDADKRMNHDLTYELLDVFYSKQSLMPDLPPQLVGTGRSYEHVRSKPSEFRLVEWPLQTLRRMRVLIEPVTVLVANFIHASAPLHPLAALQLVPLPEDALSTRSENATAALLNAGLVNSTVYAILEGLLPREVETSSGDEKK